VGSSTAKVSTLDLAPADRFTLITGIAGEAWAAAAQKVAADLGVPLAAVVIGPGREVTDLYFDWSRLREVGEDGALLVRPDKHIGWRSTSLPADPQAALHAALSALLDRAPGADPINAAMAAEGITALRAGLPAAAADPVGLADDDVSDDVSDEESG
jgi:2,4-dichlorophenol 6-monooxygenase